MSDPFIAEIRMFGGNFAPRFWAFCNGQLLPIAQNTALFALVGTTYGGNGQTTFGLPNLLDRTPIGRGQGPGLSIRDLGEQGGAESVTLLSTQIPQHTHTVPASTSAGADVSPNNETFGIMGRGRAQIYSNVAPTVPMAPTASGGGSQPHPNRQPYLTVTFIIALSGVFPPRP
jgi:microcystin-dependent protein